MSIVPADQFSQKFCSIRVAPVARPCAIWNAYAPTREGSSWHVLSIEPGIAEPAALAYANAHGLEQELYWVSPTHNRGKFPTADMLNMHIGSIYSTGMAQATGRTATRNTVNLKVKVPGTNVSLLTAASKMPGAAWSLPAIVSCPGAVFGNGMICGTDRKDPKTHTCYATKGLHRMPNVKNALKVRYQWTMQCMTSDAGFMLFVETLVNAILDDGRPYFRIHESGDMFNARYVRAWIEIARRLPNVQFWVPTRAYHHGTAKTILPALIELNSLPNVSVKPSALKISDTAPVVDGLSAGTGVKSEGFNCPASLQGNQCGDCRQCWGKDTAVYYHLH